MVTDHARLDGFHSVTILEGLNGVVALTVIG